MSEESNVLVLVLPYLKTHVSIRPQRGKEEIITHSLLGTHALPSATRQTQQKTTLKVEANTALNMRDILQNQ